MRISFIVALVAIAWVPWLAADESKPATPAAGSTSPAQIIPYPFDRQPAVAWANQHSAGMIVKQLLGDDSYPRGSMHRGEASGDLGETPPVYIYNLQTKALPILLGKEDDRHKFRRSINLIRQEGRTLESFGIFIQVEWWRSDGPGGFVFLRGEKTISKIGLIIPPVMPPSVSETDPNHTTEIRISGSGPVVHGLPEKVWEKAAEKLDHRYVVLMNAPAADWRAAAKTEPPPASAHILWVEFTQDGHLAAERTDEWFVSLEGVRDAPMLRLPGK
jgi:hypothetical protein